MILNLILVEKTFVELVIGFPEIFCGKATLHPHPDVRNIPEYFQNLL